MSEDFKIEKDIPIPNKRLKSSKYYFDIYSLEVGDSVFCPTQNMASAIRLKLKRHGFKGTTKKWENGFRVWRTE
tara:strand:+ start:495 stop:716 length:222 start_codon:yes stop_codon:yes gene_type:complete